MRGPARLLPFYLETRLCFLMTMFTRRAAARLATKRAAARLGYTAPPTQRRRPGTGASSTVSGPRTSGKEQSSTVHGECTSNEALRNGMPTPGYTGRAYGPAHAAVHLSHREELDEELDDPGGTSNDHKVTLVCCERATSGGGNHAQCTAPTGLAHVLLAS